jgi:hypothetical protein
VPIPGGMTAPLMTGPRLDRVRRRLTGLATRARLPELLLIAGRLSC